MKINPIQMTTNRLSAQTKTSTQNHNPSFKGTWGEEKNITQASKSYIPFADETDEEIKQAIASYDKKGRTENSDSRTTVVKERMKLTKFEYQNQILLTEIREINKRLDKLESYTRR